MSYFNPTKSEVRAALGGSLRPGDARRFFIEAMVGAMYADGRVDEREMTALRGVLERHELFAALPTDVAQMLIDLSTDAIEFAGGVERRVPVICGNLRWRIDRMAALGMACEVCSADDELDESEVNYLETLRAGLRLDKREHDALWNAARKDRAIQWLEEETARVRGHVGVLTELLVMRRWSQGQVDPSAVTELGPFIAGLRDLAIGEPEATRLVEEARLRSGRWRSLQEETPRLLAELPFANDRYWVMVYLLTDCQLRGQQAWVADPLIRLLAGAFHYGDVHMQQAAADAAQLVVLVDR